MNNTKQNIFVLLSIAVYCIVFSGIVISKYYQFGYNGLDLAIINQVFFTTANGQPFASSIHPPSYLGDHITPIVLLLAPLYSFFNSPIFLLLLQTATLALAAWPLYLIGKKVLPIKLQIIPPLVWLVNPFVHNINLFEFHFLSFVPITVFFLFYSYIQKRFFHFCIAILACLSIREDITFILFAIGMIALIEKRTLRWWLTPITASVAWFAVALMISQVFSVSGAYKFLLYYAWAGDTTSEIIKTIITQPWLLIPKIINPGSILVAFALLLPIAFTALKKPKCLLVSVPSFVVLITGTQWQWVSMILFTQYSAIVLPGVFIAGIYGFLAMNKQIAASKLKKHAPLAGLIALTSVIYGSITLGPLPQALTNLSLTEEQKQQWQMIQSIPKDATVASGYATLAPLSSRAQVASLQYVFLGGLQFLGSDYSLPTTTQYLVIDDNDLATYELQFRNNSLYEQRYPKARQSWHQMFKNFELVQRVGTLSVYKKSQNPTAQFSTTEEPLVNQAQIINELQILSIVKNNNSLEIIWKGTEQLKNDYFLEIKTHNNTRYVHISYGQIPYEKWPINQPIKIIYTLTEQEKNEISALLLVHSLQGGIELDNKRSIIDFISHQESYSIELN